MKAFKKHIAIILVTLLILTQLSVLFPMFSLFSTVSNAAVLTSTEVASFNNQKWLIDEIIKQVRLTRPTVSSFNQVTTEDLALITIINLNGIATTGAAARSRWAYSTWNRSTY